jgi:hypothetical protein
MSANNWAICICPECERRAKLAQARALEKANAAYGKVPPEKYMELVAKAKERQPAVETLREDYGLGIDSDGTFYVSYRAYCEQCKFEFNYNHKESAVKGDLR